MVTRAGCAAKRSQMVGVAVTTPARRDAAQSSTRPTVHSAGARRGPGSQSFSRIFSR